MLAPRPIHGRKPYISETSEPAVALSSNTELDAISPGLLDADAILRSILQSLTPHNSCAEITRALGQRAVEVTVQITKLVEAKSDAPEWPRHIASLVETLREIHLFIQSETEGSSLDNVLLGRTISHRHVVLEQCLNSVLCSAEQYDKKLEATKEGTKCGEMFSNAHHFFINGGTYYNGQIFIQQTSEKQSCQPTPGIVPGVRVVAFEDVFLKREISYWNEHYRLHSAYDSGKARVVKVYRGPRGKERAQEAGRFHRRVMHSSILHMAAVSPCESEIPFLVFHGELEGSLEVSLARTLRKDLRMSLILGVRTVATLSSGFDYIWRDVNYPCASAQLKHFSVFLTLEGEVVISFDPDIIHNDEYDHEEGSSQALRVFHGLCQQTFDAACQGHYDGQQIDRGYAEGEAFIEEVLSDSADAGEDSPSVGSPETSVKRYPGGEPVHHQRRELVWKPDGEPEVTLGDIHRGFKAYHDELLAASNKPLGQRRGGFTARTAHRCEGYNRTEITLTPSIARSEIVTHSAPLPHEICPVCDHVVKDAEIFNCICGHKDDGSLPTIQCSMCNEWHHRGCTDGRELKGHRFTCFTCGPMSKDLGIQNDRQQPPSVKPHGNTPDAETISTVLGGTNSEENESSFRPPSRRKVFEDPLPAFRDFVKNEKQRLTEKRRALAKSDADKRMADLVKFSQPIPKDMVPILTKSEDRQPQIIETAKRDSASAKVRVITPAGPHFASRGLPSTSIRAPLSQVSTVPSDKSSSQSAKKKKKGRAAASGGPKR